MLDPGVSQPCRGALCGNPGGGTTRHSLHRIGRCSPFEGRVRNLVDNARIRAGGGINGVGEGPLKIYAAGQPAQAMLRHQQPAELGAQSGAVLKRSRDSRRAFSFALMFAPVMVNAEVKRRSTAIGVRR